MRGWTVYLTGEQLFINAHQKEILLAISFQLITLSLAGHLGFGDCNLLPDLYLASTQTQNTFICYSILARLT